MRANVLVDSHVYIDLLKNRLDPAAVLADWAGNRHLVICGMVRVEVLRGIKNPAVYERMSAFMDVMLNVISDNQLWSDTAALAWKLDRRGWVIPGTDLIIAASALRLGTDILTSDHHFQKIEGLQTIQPPTNWLEK